MYCYYAYNSSWTVAQVLDDVRLLCTGTTNKASLSASCDQANTTITNTVAADWTTHDSAEGSAVAGFVLSRADSTAASTKYFRAACASGVSVSFTVLEGWNAGTNTATNASSNISFSIGTLGVAGYLHVAVTADYIIICANGTTNVMYCVELNRDTPKIEGSVPVTAVFGRSSSSSGFMPKVHDGYGSTFLTGGSAPVWFAGIVAWNEPSTTGGGLGVNTNMTRASDNSQFLGITPVYVVWRDANTPPRSVPLGSVRGTYGILGTGSGGDTITYNSKTYMLPTMLAGFAGVLIPLE